MDAIRVGFREAALLAWTWGAVTVAGIPYNAGNVVALPRTPSAWCSSSV